MTSAGRRRRLAGGAPISWGVCEVPGWGRMLPRRAGARRDGVARPRGDRARPDRLSAARPAAICARARPPRPARSSAASCRSSLHEPTLDDARAAGADRGACWPRAGAEVFVAAARARRRLVRAAPARRRGWDAARRATSTRSSALVARHGLTLALHPHAGTQVETRRRTSSAMLGGLRRRLVPRHRPPADRRRRPRGLRPPPRRPHRARAPQGRRRGDRRALRAGELTLVEATQAGLFRPLGQGRRAASTRWSICSHAAGYERWLVLEQDTAITGEEPPVGSGPVIDVRTSIDVPALAGSARRERVAES